MVTKQSTLRGESATTLTHLMPFIKPERRRLLYAAALTLLLTIVEVATPLLAGVFVDSILVSSDGHSSVFIDWIVGRKSGDAPIAFPLWIRPVIVLLLVALALARGLLLTHQRALAGKIGERVAARLRNKLWEHLLRAPLDYVRRRGSGRVLLRFTSDTRAVQRLVTQGMVRLAQDMLLGGAIITALLWLNWQMGLAIAFVLPVYAVIFARLNPRLRHESRATRRRRSRLSAYLNEHLTGLATIKAGGRESGETQRGKEHTRDLARRGTRLAKVSGQLQGLSATAIALSSVLVLALAAREVSAGRLTGGMLVAFYILLGLLLPLFQRIVIANRYFQEAAISVERLAETLAEPAESSADAQRPALAVSAGVLTIENVSFRHEANKLALDGAGLVARRGEVIALAGPNGAGKSTLLGLLLRFNHPTSGRILIDGQDIADVSLASLRSQVGLASQDVPLFDGTLLDNISYNSATELTQTQIERAARLAGVEPLVATLSEGWATPVGENGRALSGGGRQRVALARALATDPPILVFDEATSALDAETEGMLANTLRQLAQEKTVIVAAHRLPTLQAADRIYVLDRGRICEHGTHDALLRRGGVYARLYGNQDCQLATESVVA